MTELEENPTIKDRTEYFECKCHTVSCVMAVTSTYWPRSRNWPADKDLVFYLQHNPYLPWYKRIYHALRYVFNLTPQNYHWGEIQIRDEDLPRLKELIKEYEDYPVTSK